MNNPGFLFFFLWLYIPATFGNGILVEQMGAGVMEGKPGEVVSLVVRLTNQSEADVKVSPAWSLPDGWMSISNPSSISLPIGESVVKILSVRISPKANAGPYPIKFEVKSTDLAISGNSTLHLNVIEIRQLLLEPTSQPEYVKAGDNARSTFILQNLGNTANNFWINTENGKLEQDPAVHLEPGESIGLSVTTKTLNSIRSSGRVFQKVFVGLAGSKEILAYASSFTVVVPSVQNDEGNGLYLPVSLRLSQITRHWQDGQNSIGFQGELYTSGTLDEAGNNQFEMRLRGPDRFGVSLLGQFDEYFASLKTPKYSAHIGDKVFSLSPLTDFARYGRGIEASVNNNGYEMGGYIQRPRFFPELDQVAAGYLRYHHHEKSTLTFNAMHKIYTEGKGDAVLGGVHGTLMTMANTHLEAELSRGLLSGSNWGNAINFRVDSSPTDKWLLAANFVHAGKNYPGFYTNTTFFNVQANYQATSKLGFLLLLNQDERNASRDTLFAIAPFSRQAQAGVFYKFKNGIQVRSYLRHNELEDRMPSLKFHYLEDAFRVQVEKNWEKVQLTFTNEYGNRENLLPGIEDKYSKTFTFLFNGGYQVSSRFSIEGVLQYYRFNRFADPERRQWIFGGRLHAEPFPYSRLSLTFQSNYQLEEYYRNRNLFDLRFSQSWGKRKNHELSASSNIVLLQRTQSDRDVSFQVNYTWRFGIRKGSEKITQGVTGQILNKGAESISGVVLLLNGRKAVTDESGKFYFNNVPVGKYFLMIDPTSIALHELPDVVFPLEIVVEEGADVSIGFGLTKSISVGGTIDIEPETKNIRNAKSTQQPELFIFEISNEHETFRRISDNKNCFDFPDIRPGKWKLRILNPEGYSGFYFERWEWNLDVEPGQTINLNIKLLRKKKKIKFQDSLGTSDMKD